MIIATVTEKRRLDAIIAEILDVAAGLPVHSVARQTLTRLAADLRRATAAIVVREGRADP